MPVGTVTEEAEAQEERDHYTQVFHENGRSLTRRSYKDRDEYLTSYSGKRERERGREREIDREREILKI